MKQKLSILAAILFLININFTTASAQTKSLIGIWQFNGGVYNGKRDTASLAYTMRRIYTSKDFTAFASQKGYKTERYEAGTYILKGDTCFEKQIFSSRPSQSTGKTVKYIFKIHNNELIFSGTLPSGMVVEEHWKKVLVTAKK